MIDVEREAFEKWFGSRVWPTTMQPSAGDKARMFISWQAARAQQGEAELVALRYTNDGALAECPCCGSLDVGGACNTVHCYKCGLKIEMDGPLQNACDAWNKRSGTNPPTAAAGGVPDGWALVPEDLRTHFEDFADAVCVMAEDEKGADGGSGYWAHQEKTIERIRAQMLTAAPSPDPVCETCNGSGRIGGPTYYAPDEGGELCPDCSAPSPEQPKPTNRYYCSAVICNGCGHVYMEKPTSCDCGNDESLNGFESAAVFVASDLDKAPEQPKPTNRYGVDAPYFHGKLSLVLRDLENYTPDELARALARLVVVADKDVLAEPEFTPEQAAAPRSGWIRCSEEMPKRGQRVRLFSQGVIQHYMPVLDEGDEGPFWSFDGICDYDPPVDFKRDQWKPMDQPPAEDE